MSAEYGGNRLNNPTANLNGLQLESLSVSFALRSAPALHPLSSF